MTSAGSGPSRQVREVIAPVVDRAGLFLEDVAVSRAGRRSVVRVVVDLDEGAVGSLGSEQLGEVSRDISAAMDAADPVRGEYVLEVTTPGTSRPLTELRHFRRARTRLVRVELRDGRTVQGRLVEADAGWLVVQGEAGDRTIEMDEVVRGHVELDFRGTADDEGDEGDDGDIHESTDEDTEEGR